MDYLKYITPGQILPQLKKEWLAVYVWVACNGQGTDEPFYGRREIKFQVKGGRIHTISEEDLHRFGISTELYRGLAQSTDGELYLPTTDKSKASQWIEKLRDLLDTFIGIPARPVKLGVKKLPPIWSKNTFKKGFIVRKIQFNLRKMPENKADQTFRDTQEPDGETLKGKSYRELFNEHGGKKIILPPFNPDFRIASDRVMQLKHFRNSRMPEIETLVRAAHTVSMEFRDSTRYSAEVGVSSKGLVHLVMHTPNGSQTSQSVVDRLEVVSLIQRYLDDIQAKQQDIAQKAETKT